MVDQADVSKFLDYLHINPLGVILDRAAGITPAQRLEMNRLEEERDARLNNIAESALAKLSAEEIEAVEHVMTRDF